MERIILWDFQGTLAHNEYMFSKVLYGVMSDEDKEKFNLQNFKNKKLVGFPWQKCELRYEPKYWWENAQKIFNKIYLELGLNKKEALKYTSKIKKEFLKAKDFILYPESIEVLKYFKYMGYKNIILSNHIPELDIIVNRNRNRKIYIRMYFIRADRI
ncbi:MAG: hypothetical protein ACRDAU_11925 [Clostridium sp.]